MSAERPLPEFLTRAEAAKVLRIGVRQIDRITKSGELPKRRLSGNRRGILREDLERYLGAPTADRYISAVEEIQLVIDRPLNLSGLNVLAKALDKFLLERMPGCLVMVQDDGIHVCWNIGLGYTPEQLTELLNAKLAKR